MGVKLGSIQVVKGVKGNTYREFIPEDNEKVHALKMKLQEMLRYIDFSDFEAFK